MADSNHTRTSYIVLQRDADGRYTPIVDGLQAHSAKAAAVAAARALVDTADLDAGVELRAISFRSWDAGHATYKAKHQMRIVPT